jgi:hypothetical protein
MGTCTTMECKCGYSKKVTVGAGRRDFKSVCSFPCYCKICGMVSSNLFADRVVCSNCGTDDIIRYGERQITRKVRFLGFHIARLDFKEWQYDPRVTKPVGHAVISWLDYRLTVGEHLCPDCRDFSLLINFDYNIYFD